MHLTISDGRANALFSGLICVWMAAWPLSGHAAEVYKHVDAQGRVTYSDHAISTETQKVEIRVQEANPAEAARIAREQALLAAGDKRRSAQKSAEQKATAQREAADHARQQRCAEARRQYQVVSENSRVYRLDDQGNRVFYSSPDLDARRISAKATMDNLCGS